MASTKARSEKSTAAESARQPIDGNVTALLKSADVGSADRIQNISQIYQARISRLTRTAALLTKGSTPAKAAAETVTAAQTILAQIQVLHQQAATTTPSVAAGGWALHGRVYNAQLQPLASHTVFLVDNEKKYQSDYGFAYTDSTGYFLINFAGNTPASSAKRTAPSGKSAAAAEISTDELFVQIVNTGAQPVYLSALAFQTVWGNATYQNITLPAGEPVLGDPPKTIRQVALPRPKTSR